MVCLWRRTFASVFLLLSSHNVRVLSQNVVPNGPMAPLSLLRDPLRERAGFNPGFVPQQPNLYPNPPNGVQQEFVQLGPSGLEYQRIPENFGPVLTQAQPCNSMPQSNIGQIPLDSRFNIPQINSFPPLQSSVSHTLPNVNFNGQPFNIPPKSNIAPLQGPSSYIPPVTSNSQGQTVSSSPIINLPNPLGFKPNILPIKNSQESIPSGLELPNTRPALNILPNGQNQNTQTFPLSSSLCPQTVATLSGEPCTLTTDLTSMRLFPTPNLPSSIPVQNYAQTPQSPIQSLVYPQSTDYLLNTPNYQISALPPVFPTNEPQSFDSARGKFQTNAEDYSPVPINLQINVPSTTIPEPKITIITAYPSNPALPASVSTTDSSEVSFGMSPSYPLPPMIIEGRRSRSNTWLPLFLIALFARDGYGEGGGYCCCCPCNVETADIPIPYPIPIPTNNPIIVKNSSRSIKKKPKPKTTVKKKV